MKLRTKLLVASAAALAAAEVASAQVVNFGGRNGVTISPGGVVPNAAVGGYGYSPAPYYSGAWNNTPYRGTYPGWSGYNQPSVTTRPGSNYFPATNQYYVNPNPAYYTTPNTGVTQSSGYSNTTPGMIQQSAYTFPQQPNQSGIVQTGFSMPQDWTSDRIVSTQVLAPDGAQVTLSGTPADRNQGARPFISPPLDPNKTYSYRAKATWVDQNGQQQTREKNVEVKAGQQVTIDLNRADADTPPVGEPNKSDTKNRDE